MITVGKSDVAVCISYQQRLELELELEFAPNRLSGRFFRRSFAPVLVQSDCVPVRIFHQAVKSEPKKGSNRITLVNEKKGVEPNYSS